MNSENIFGDVETEISQKVIKENKENSVFSDSVEKINLITKEVRVPKGGPEPIDGLKYCFEDGM